MRQDIILKPWQIELTTNSTNDSFEESTFFTGKRTHGHPWISPLLAGKAHL